MKQRIMYTTIATISYLLVANVGNLLSGVSKRVNWTSTLWEAAFFFVFIFLLLGYRKNKK